MLWREAFCPVCFRTMGGKAETVPGHPHARLGTINQWDLPDQFVGRHKPFGVIKSSEGRGSMKMEGYFEPEDDTDGYFPLVKGRLIAALQDYIRQGWLTPDEVQSAIGGINVEPAAPIKKTRTRKAKG